MPPKTEKAKVKDKEKVVEDKTFGMKNKNRSTKVQKYIQGMKASAVGSQPKTEAEKKKEAAKNPSKHELERQALLASMFGAMAAKKKEKKEDTGKIDLYVDQREQQQQAKEEDTMDKWDLSKLEEVVKTKHGSQDVQTDIVCKFFLEAVQKNLYGWFWTCPNGADCKYRHALPPGYVLKRDNPTADEDEEEISIEELVEIDRAKLKGQGTPVTEETFMAWLKSEVDRKLKEEESARDAKNKKTGPQRNMISGKDLFVLDPSLFVDEDGAASDYDIDENALSEGEDDEGNEDERIYNGEDEEEDEEEEEEEEEGEDSPKDK